MIKYEADSRLPSLKLKKTDSAPKSGFNFTEKMFNDEPGVLLDKQSVVTRLIDHLKERF